MSSLWSRFNDSGAHEDQLIMSETAREMRFKLLGSTVGTIAKQLYDGEYMRDALQSTCATTSSRNDRALARATLGIMDCHDNRDLRRLERELEGMRKEEVVLRREANALEARIENLRRNRASKKEMRDGVWPMPPTTDEEDEVDGQEEDEAEEEGEQEEDKRRRRRRRNTRRKKRKIRGRSMRGKKKKKGRRRRRKKKKKKRRRTTKRKRKRRRSSPEPT
jgi:hypothetical protein